MSVLYVKEQGAIIQKCGERLVITKKGQTLLDIPIIKVENVSIIGNVQITTQALHMLMTQGIDVSYFSYSGKYLGHTAAESSKNVFLRFEQHNFFLDEERRLEMAKKIVSNKIQNQESIIQNYRWNDEEHDWKADVEQMEKHRNSLKSAKTFNEILGVEGICSNIYFGAFACMMKGDYEFHSRNRRPPKDPVNVILSLGYTFLTREMCNALDSESFETYIGFLHGIRYGRKSLALDIIEEFRQPIIDRLTLLLFNKRMLGKYDFDFQEEGGVSLNEEGFKKFCAEYEKWMTGRNSIAGDNYRKRIQEQVSLLKKSICKNEEYHPYNWREQYVFDKL